MTQHYSNPERASDPHALPDMETFYVGADYRKVPDFAAHYGCPLCGDPSQLVIQDQQEALDEHNTEHVRWYWQPCFPGCLPDGEPNGPFDTEAEAVADAQAGAAYERGDCTCDEGGAAGCPVHDPDELPPCVLSMRCYCAGHARGNPASEPCDTSEEGS